MRKLAWFAASCSAAVFLAVYVLPEGAGSAGEVCALAALAGLTLRGDRRRRVLLAGFGLAAGLLWTAAYGALFQAPARALAGYEGPVEVTVADWPQATAYGSSVLVRLHPVEGWPVRTLLYLDAPAPDLRPGDGLTVQARLRAADTITGESTDYYYAKGVRLIAYGEGRETVRPGRPPLWTWPAYVSKALKDRVAAAFPEEAAPLVTALLTGDRSGLSDGDYAALRRSGLAHVIAVSGLHVSFLAGLAAALLGARRRRTAVCTIALLVCFAAVVGNTPSVLRAVFMQSMLLLAPLLGREEDKPTSLCAVLMLLLLQNPYAAASVSLQLSFAAVAGIYLFSGPLTERWTARLPARPKGFWAKTGCLAARFVLSSLAVSLGAIAFTTPLTAWHFQSVSLAGRWPTCSACGRCPWPSWAGWRRRCWGVSPRPGGPAGPPGGAPRALCPADGGRPGGAALRRAFHPVGILEALAGAGLRPAAALSARAGGEKAAPGTPGPGDGRAVRGPGAPGRVPHRRAAHRLGAGRGTGPVGGPALRRARRPGGLRRHRGGQPRRHRCRLLPVPGPEPD
ncbi:MAG: ComEC/Rec2 family competence protein [Flavonifractor plautii]